MPLVFQPVTISGKRIHIRRDVNLVLSFSLDHLVIKKLFASAIPKIPPFLFSILLRSSTLSPPILRKYIEIISF